MNIITNIKDRFVSTEAPEVKWVIHWYAHIIYISESFSYVKYDHTGILTDWTNQLYYPQLGEQVNIITPVTRKVKGLPIIMTGTVTDITHHSSCEGGYIGVYTNEFILMQNGITTVPKMASKYITDEMYTIIQEQRKLILMGEQLPLNHWINL